MAAELKIGIGADNSGLNKGLQDAEKQITAFVNKVGKIGQIGEQLASIGQKMSVGLTLPIIALGGAAIKAYGDIQSLHKGLEAVMGSGAAATKEFERLKEVARLPGLGMEEAVRGSINLQAIGIDADRSRKILSQFGNAVASVGKGKAEFERAIYGVQQLANTDFPLGEDLNIIKDALPQVSNLLKEAFGSSRSDELAKMGVSSAQVLDVITKGLEKLPRVTGGINGAFENLGDSMKTSLARIGKIIDDTFDISGIIDKLTGYLDSAVSAFENLSPSVQKTILVVTGLVAAAGPLLVAVGSLIAMGPQLLLLLGGIKVAMLAITGPVGAAVLAIAGLTAAYFTLRDSTKTSADKMLEWGESLRNANAQASTQVTALDALYKKTQDTTLSIKERKAAVDDLQAQYPYYFKNIKDEIILNGGAVKSYQDLRVAIVNAARAKAAQGEIEKRAAERLQTELDLRKRLASAVQTYQAPKAQNFASGGTMAGSGGTFISEDEVKESARKSIYWIQKELNRIGAVATAEDAELMKIIEAGSSDIANVYGNRGTETAAAIVASTAKTKAALTTAAVEIKDFENEFAQNTAGLRIGAIEFASFNEMDAWFNNLTVKLKEAVPKVKGAIVEFSESILPTFDQLNTEINSLIQDSISPAIFNAFDAIGQAIGSGGNVIAAFGNSLLSSLGSFLSQMGKMLIEYGTLAIVKGKLDLAIAAGGPIAIAAGIAAVAIGSLLAVAGGALGTLANKGSSGGGSVPSGGGNSSQSYSSSFSGGSSGGEGRVVFEISGNNLIGVLDRAKDRNTRLGG